MIFLTLRSYFSRVKTFKKNRIRYYILLKTCVIYVHFRTITSGEMAEWSNAAVSKAVIPRKMGSGVRIPLSPPEYEHKTI